MSKKKKNSSFNLIFFKQAALNSHLNECVNLFCLITTPPLAHFIIVCVSNEVFLINCSDVWNTESNLYLMILKDFFWWILYDIRIVIMKSCTIS